LTGRLAAALLPLVAVAPAAASKGAEAPRIEALEVRQVDDRIEVSFRVVNGLALKETERIRSGLPVRQRHRVEVVSKRAVPLWPAKVHRGLRIDTSAVYDSLTGRYELTRKLAIGGRKNLPPLVREDRRATESFDEVRSWMTEFDALPPLELPDSAANARLRVRVSSTLRRRFVLYVFPGKVSVSAERRLEP
jgi:hypothetical protein